LFVIVQVFVAQRKAIDSLREHLGNRMFHQGLIPAVEERLCQSPYQVQPLVGLAQQERPAVGTDRSYYNMIYT
jgi:hypothetical protein